MKTIEIQLTKHELFDLEEMARIHLLPLQEYLSEIVKRDLQLYGILTERHPHLFDTNNN